MLLLSKQTKLPNMRDKVSMSLNISLRRAWNEKQMLSGHLERPASSGGSRTQSTSPGRRSQTYRVLTHGLMLWVTQIPAQRMSPVPMSGNSAIVQNAFPKNPSSQWELSWHQEHQAWHSFDHRKPVAESQPSLRGAILRALVDTSALCCPGLQTRSCKFSWGKQGTACTTSATSHFPNAQSSKGNKRGSYRHSSWAFIKALESQDT